MKVWARMSRLALFSIYASLWRLGGRFKMAVEGDSETSRIRQSRRSLEFFTYEGDILADRLYTRWC